MKLKKLSGLLSAVLAGAMVLSMAPAAFAVATDELPAECDHIQQVAVDNHDGTCSYVCKVDGTVINTMEHIWDKDGTCVRCNAKKAATDTSDCEHKNNNWIYKNLGDGTHNVVCADCGAVVSANVACNYKNGVCSTCGAKQPAKADDGIATKPGNGTMDPNFGMGYHPIREFFRAVFRFLFGRH